MELSVGDVKTMFVDRWRSTLKGANEQTENVLLHEVSDEHKQNLREIVILQKEALLRLQMLETALGNFGEAISGLMELTE